MTLQLSPELRKVYDREKQRQHNRAYRERQADKVWLREQRYREIEQRIAEALAENERMKAWCQRTEAAMADLKANPPERVVTQTVVEKVPTLMHVGNIAAVLKLCREAEPHWLEALWAELEPLMRPFVKKID